MFVLVEESNKKAILGFLAPVAVGTLCLEAITVLVFIIIKKFSMGVIWGALWGTAVMVLYYFLMSLAVIKAASGNPEDVKKRIQASYSMRMLMLLVLMGIGLYLSSYLNLMNWIPMLLACIYPRISIAVYSAFKAKKDSADEAVDSSESEKDGEI